MTLTVDWVAANSGPAPPRSEAGAMTRPAQPRSPHYSDQLVPPNSTAEFDMLLQRTQTRSVSLVAQPDSPAHCAWRRAPFPDHRMGLMPADPLTPNRAGTVSPDDMADAVLGVLGGAVTVEGAAARLGVPTVDLMDAVDVFRQAGRTALSQAVVATDWCRVYVRCASRDTAEDAAAFVLGPRLNQLHDQGLWRWWYSRNA